MIKSVKFWFRKLTTGESLDEFEKAHLASCPGCMAEVIRTLDESAAKKHRNNGRVNGADDELKHARPEAKKAVEHGRLVLQREFGISLSKD